MHKPFYASGFLFHPQSQQILLQQTNLSEDASLSTLSLFVGKNKASETPTQAFQRVIHEELGIKIAEDHIHAIYSYQDAESQKERHVFYAEASDRDVEKSSKIGAGVAWIGFKKLYKLKISRNLLQDLTVGQRVINAASRDEYLQTNQ